MPPPREGNDAHVVEAASVPATYYPTATIRESASPALSLCTRTIPSVRKQVPVDAVQWKIMLLLQLFLFLEVGGRLLGKTVWEKSCCANIVITILIGDVHRRRLAGSWLWLIFPRVERELFTLQ